MSVSATSSAWVPTLHGALLPPLPDLAPIKSKTPDPNSVRDRPWSYVVLSSTFPGIPPGSGAVWHAIIAIWQLRRLEMDGKDGVLWAQYIAAWLIRYDQLCRDFQMQWHQVVVSYFMDLWRARKLLSHSTLGMPAPGSSGNHHSPNDAPLSPPTPVRRPASRNSQLPRGPQTPTRRPSRPLPQRSSQAGSNVGSNQDPQASTSGASMQVDFFPYHG